MNFCICYHTKDEAAVTVLREIQKLSLNIPVYAFSDGEHLIFEDGLDQKVKEDFIIFISKHQAKEHSQTVTVHSIGNFGNALYGGKEGFLCPASALVQKNLFLALSEAVKNSPYRCSLEATHHGPFIEKPSCFLELGSSKEEWQDPEGGKILAQALSLFLQAPGKKFTPAIGIGGGHYCTSFTKLQLSSEYAFSYILPNYHLPFTEHMIHEMIEKSVEKDPLVLVDEKGMGRKEQEQVIAILEKMGLKYARADQI